MGKKRSFDVRQPKAIVWMSLFIKAFFILYLIIEQITRRSVTVVDIVLAAVFVFIPCGVLALWALMFRIRVVGTTIHVRRFFGIVNYNFDVTEISAVKCVEAQTKMGLNRKITLHTTGGKKIPVETAMINSNKAIQFIEENVDSSKFTIISKSFR